MLRFFFNIVKSNPSLPADGRSRGRDEHDWSWSQELKFFRSDFKRLDLNCQSRTHDLGSLRICSDLHNTVLPIYSKLDPYFNNWGCTQILSQKTAKQEAKTSCWFITSDQPKTQRQNHRGGQAPPWTCCCCWSCILFLLQFHFFPTTGRFFHNPSHIFPRSLLNTKP